MNNGERINYKILYDQVWNQYNIYFQTYWVHNNKFNVLGAVSSIFILVLVTVAESKAGSRWFYLPLLFLLFPFALSLVNIKRRFEIPWFGKEKLESQMLKGGDEFFKHQIDDIYHAATTLRKYKNFAEKWVSISVWSIIIGAFVFISLFTYLYLLPLICGLMQRQV
jgi:hypothetical protein